MLFFTVKSDIHFEHSILYQKMRENIDSFLEYKFENGKHTGNYAIIKCLSYIKNLTGEQHPQLNSYLKEVTYFISAHFINKFDYFIDFLRNDGIDKSVAVSELIDLKTEWIEFSTVLFRASYKKECCSHHRYIRLWYRFGMQARTNPSKYKKIIGK